jgi:glycosyltransferase involved in cell wall biosynthesis
VKRVSLVVPCYNEEARLDAGALRAAHLDGRELELVLVDDGSRDRTREVLQSLAGEKPGQIRTLVLEHNQGKAEAVRQGVLDALRREPDAVGFWDADLATPLAELEDFVRVLETRPEVDIVIGSRVKLMGRTIERYAWRHYLGRLFATAASVVLDLPVYDTQCGSKLFRATPLLGRVFAEPFLARWIFDVEILARFMDLAEPGGPFRMNAALYELPVRQWVDVRGSKVRPLDFVKSARDLARIERAYRRQRASRA